MRKIILLAGGVLLIAAGAALLGAAVLLMMEIPVSAPRAGDSFDVSVATFDPASIPPPQTDDADPEMLLPTPTATPATTATRPSGTPAARAATPQPAAATATPTPSRTLAPAGTPLPPLPGTLNIVLLGSDHRAGSTDWRTDTMIVVMIDPKSQRVGIVNVARDVLVSIPGRSPNRVNTLDEFGGPPLVKQVLGSLLGITIDYYVRVNFEGMVKAIDTIGPINVAIDCALEERYPDASKPGGVRVLKVAPPRARMDGQMALDYSRSRLSTGIFDRMRRQNRVLLGVREQMLSPDMFARIPQLYQAVQPYIQTDLPPTLILPLARTAAETKLSNVHGMTIDLNLAPSVISPQGWWVMLPDVNKVRAAVRGVFSATPLMDTVNRPGGCN
ncbi:MAG: LCP family protein [Chloroflexi bacterium]|nr:LCP family protein [Chloroflexota bacterium]